MKKRLFASLLCFAMLFSLLPMSALATEPDTVANGSYSSSEWSVAKDGDDAYDGSLVDSSTGINVSKTAVWNPELKQYDVTLRIESPFSSSMEDIPSATVLVLDTSSSMTANSRLEPMQKAAKAFIEAYKNSTAARYISIVLFNTGAYLGTTGWQDITDENVYNEIITKIDGIDTDFGTALDAGLYAAAYMLDNIGAGEGITSPSQKNVIILTDGLPSRVISDPSKFFVGDYVSTIDDDIPAATDSAVTASKALAGKANLYGIALAEEDQALGLIIPPDRLYSIDDTDLNNTLTEKFKSIQESISSGFTCVGSVVEDKMGDGVMLVVDSIDKTGISNLSTEGFTWKLTKDQAKVENDTYIYTKNYTVELDKEYNFTDTDQGFVPLNKPTSLTSPEGNAEQIGSIEFPVPGVPVYTVTYIDNLNPAQNPTQSTNHAFNATTPVYGGDDLVIPTCPGYVFVGWGTDKDAKGVEGVTGVDSSVTGNATYYAMWEPDVVGRSILDANDPLPDLNDPQNPENPPVDTYSDGVPDRYQLPVTYQIVHGNWVTQEDNDKQTYVTLYDEEGNWVDAATATPQDVGHLNTVDNGMVYDVYGNWVGLDDPSGAAPNQIPDPGEPDSGYRSDGSWSPAVPLPFGDENQTEITEQNNHFVYTFPRSGGGGGGGDKPVLNTKDHYGYIIGYPVDYVTGEATNDQTRMPVRPEGNITRAEVATIFFRMLTDASRDQHWSQENSFSDVNQGDWFNAAISTLANAELINGYSNGTYNPNGYITRAEFATIASRFFGDQFTKDSRFKDIDGHWAEAYISIAAAQGLVTGYEDGTFQPDQLITRAEAITLMNRTLDRHPDKDKLLKDMLVWPDNMDTSKWYYAEMQEATNSHKYTMSTDKKTGEKVETWTKVLPIRDWVQFEKEWSNAHSADKNNGGVV